MNPQRTAPHVLLTGAGFTKNFGGFLAKELQPRILGRVSNRPELRNLLMASADWESALTSVRESGSEDTKKALQEAIYDCFREMDDVLRRQPPMDIAIARVWEFVDHFSGTEDQEGFSCLSE